MFIPSLALNSPSHLLFGIKEKQIASFVSYMAVDDFVQVDSSQLISTALRLQYQACLCGNKVY